MARRVQAYIHRFFRWCVGRGIIETNPATDLPKPGMARQRDRVLCDKELAAVWHGAETMGWPHGAAVLLLILTGARLQEIGQLRWSEITHDAITLEGDRTKNAQPHAIPLSAAAQAVLAKAPRIDNSEFVFTMSGKRAISGWSVAKIRLDGLASIAPWVIHDLRRTVATGLQKLGVGLQVVESILGHVGGSRAGVVGIYQRHTYDAEKRAALEAWGAHVTALVQ
jgi:integrase